MRLSKKNLANFIGQNLAAYEAEYGFHDRTGYAQVTGKGDAANRAYGEYSKLKDLVDVFNLDWQEVYNGRPKA